MSKKKQASQLVVNTTDFYGNAVTLHQNTWENHILIEHSAMVGTELLVKTTVEAPDEIRVSSQFDTSLAFFSPPGAGGHPQGIRVLVDYADIFYEKGSTTGKIVTAYPIDTINYALPQLGKHLYKKGGRK